MKSIVNSLPKMIRRFVGLQRLEKGLRPKSRSWVSYGNLGRVWHWAFAS